MNAKEFFAIFLWDWFHLFFEQCKFWFVKHPIFFFKINFVFDLLVTWAFNLLTIIYIVFDAEYVGMFTVLDPNYY